ncbi:MAG: hypothetical protein IIB95_13005 [Candidatus Marinimicrobia bacterium]|nr:hypothetical protein [Candidatus Neomarinimicrobiota bacterium]
MSKRQSKISCDISEEAKGMLSGYCLKHERSQGWLIEKMIRQFCVEVKTAMAPDKEKKEPKKADSVGAKGVSRGTVPGPKRKSQCSSIK